MAFMPMDIHKFVELMRRGVPSPLRHVDSTMPNGRLHRIGTTTATALPQAFPPIYVAKGRIILATLLARIFPVIHSYHHAHGAVQFKRKVVPSQDK